MRLSGQWGEDTIVASGPQARIVAGSGRRFFFGGGEDDNRLGQMFRIDARGEFDVIDGELPVDPQVDLPAAGREWAWGLNHHLARAEYGKDGHVWRTSRPSALKVHQRREWEYGRDRIRTCEGRAIRFTV